MVTLAYGLVPLVYHIMINPFVLSLVSDAAFNALPFVFSWILFQLPITEQPPAPNVAGSSQVRLPLIVVYRVIEMNHPPGPFVQSLVSGGRCDAVGMVYLPVR